MNIRKQPAQLSEEELEQYPMLTLIPSMRAIVRYSVSDWLVGHHFADWLSKGDWDYPVIKRRDVKALLCDGEDCILARFELRIYSFSTLIDNQEVLFLMDADEEYENRLGVMLASHWEDFGSSLSDFGDVIEIYGIWLDIEQVELNLMTEAIEYLIMDLDKNEHSIQVVNASSIDFDESRGTKKEQELWFNAQRAELKEVFRTTFGFDPLPGQFGSDGWMWKPNSKKADVIARPKPSNKHKLRLT